MTSNYLDMTVIEFLDTITNKKQEYSLKIGGKIQYIGTKPELQDLLSEVSEEEYSEISTLFLDKEEYTTPFELTSIEIYNYLEKITSNFNLTKVKLILQEMEMYNCMVFNERINEESLNIYKKNEWEIPSIEFNPLFPKGAPLVKMADLKTMTRKTHFCASWNIDHAISLLKDIQLNGKIAETISTTFQKTTDRGCRLSSLIESPHLNSWVPKLSLSDNYIEGSQPVANRFRPDGPNWDLIFGEINETNKAKEKERIETTKRSLLIESFKVKNEDLTNDSQGQREEAKNPIENPYPQIFKDPKAFKLFEYLLDQFKGKKIKHVNCSFIFRQMQEDKYIFINISENDFRLFLSSYYQIDIDKLKTLPYCNTESKMTIYSNAVHNQS